MVTKIQQALKVCVKYSNKDTFWYNEFKTHLDAYPRSIVLTDNLAVADICVLLVTPAFISEFIGFLMNLSQYFSQPIQRTQLFWIAISHSAYEATPLKQYKAANDPYYPLAKLRPVVRQKKWVEICKMIEEYIKIHYLTFHLWNADITDPMISEIAKIAEKELLRIGIKFATDNISILRHASNIATSIEKISIIDPYTDLKSSFVHNKPECINIHVYRMIVDVKDSSPYGYSIPEMMAVLYGIEGPGVILASRNWNSEHLGSVLAEEILRML